jgi:diacylglycerol O-acyltransferase / wax synthase
MLAVQRLSGLDAAFLALETPEAHMQILGVAILDPHSASERFSYARVRELFEARLHLVPPFRRRVVEVPLGLNNPVWIEDPDFDLDYHLRRAALPAPGGAAELTAFVADIASRPLDRAKPLWEAYVVEGLEHGWYAFIAKLHHSLIDGVSGIEILARLFDLEPDAALDPPESAPEWHPDHVPNDFEMLGYGAFALARRPAEAVRAAVNLGQGVARAIRRARDAALHVTLPLTAPRLSMNRTITPHRIVSFSSVSLDDVKTTKNALGVTVNDVVLAVAAGALRSYLEARGELPDRPLVAAIPTSVRHADTPAFGNRVSSMFASLPVDVDDPIERVRAVALSMTGAKGVHEEVGGSTLEEWAEITAPIIFSRAIRFYSRLRVAERIRPAVNCVVSNVPGPPVPIYFAGARLVALHPLGPIFDDLGLNLTVMSYLDHVDFGFIACREVMPDADSLAARVPDAMAELMKAAVV